MTLNVTFLTKEEVYVHEKEKDIWKIGFVVNHTTDELIVEIQGNTKACDEKNVFIRKRNRLNNPLDLISNHTNSKKIINEKRRAYYNYFYEKLDKTFGLSCLLSSSIKLETYQLEVVRRVLNDPVQRYLLADEVGLGKTIEACLVIKQYIIDEPFNHKVIIVCPDNLRKQWGMELEQRFF